MTTLVSHRVLNRTVLSLFVRRHGVHLQIEWPPIAQVEDALFIAAFQCVRRLSREANVSWSVYFLPCAVRSDIGECPLQPDIHLVARMTVIGDYIFRRRSQENLSAALR